MKQTAIIVIQNGADALTKAQKDFNAFTQKIEDLRQEIADFDAGKQRLHQRSIKELQPLYTKLDNVKADIVRVLDRQSNTIKLKARDKEKFTHLILSLSAELIDKGYEELKEIFNRYSDLPYDEEMAETEILVTEEMKKMFEEMYGIEFEADADISTPEKMEAYIAAKLEEAEAEAWEKQRLKEAQKKEGPQTERQAAAEKKRAEKAAKKAAEEKSISKSVREVYMDLVKAFHPDREQDETEKIRKTEIMQRITAAYESNDLLLLLNLQLELERISASDLETLPEERIKHYNKTLQRQILDLQTHLKEQRAHLAKQFGMASATKFSIQQLEHKLQFTIKDLKAAIKELREDSESMRNEEFLKSWLKMYEMY